MTPQWRQVTYRMRDSFQSLVSNVLDLYPVKDREEGNSVSSDVVSLSFSVDGNELEIDNMPSEISISIPRSAKERSGGDKAIEGSMGSDKYTIHSFEITHNASAVHLRVEWSVNVEIDVHVRKGNKPSPQDGLYDFNDTLRLGSQLNASSSNSSERSGVEIFLSNDALNWTAAGKYYVALRYVKNDSLPKEEDKISADGTIRYNFSIYTSMCMYYNVLRGAWSTDGLKVRDINHSIVPITRLDSLLTPPHWVFSRPL